MPFVRVRVDACSRKIRKSCWKMLVDLSLIDPRFLKLVYSNERIRALEQPNVVVLVAALEATIAGP